LLIFEYTKKYPIEPISLINDAPGIWRWSNPDISIASWMLSVFLIPDLSDPTKLYRFVGAYINSITRLTFMDSGADMLATEYSCWWDSTTQVMLFNLASDNPHTYTAIDMLQLFGATDTTTKVFEGVTYLPLILNAPNIERRADPLLYEKQNDFDVSVLLKNDSTIKSTLAGAFEQYWRFDANEIFTGQLTWLKWGEDDTAYADLEIRHKGIVANVITSLKEIEFICDDIRSKADADWPTYTFEDAGYTADNVDENLLDKVIPDGFGVNHTVEGNCVNRDYAIVALDDDGNIATLPTSLVDYDITTWTAVSVDVVKTTKQIAKFTMYRVEKNAGITLAFAQDTLVATATKYKISGYVKVPELYTQSGVSIDLFDDAPNYLAGLKIEFVTKTYSQANTTNLRIKFLGEGEDTYAYFSYEYQSFVAGGSYTIKLYPDNNSATNNVVAYFAGIKVTPVVYTQFIFSKELTTLTQLYYAKDDELHEITEVSVASNVVNIHDVDAHVDGDVTKGLNKIYADVTLRSEANPFDIIKVLNEEAASKSYLDTYYNKAVCEVEQDKLADIGFIIDTPTSLYELISNIQSGSTVGFRYDDVDKITIMCDDPNKTLTFSIKKESIINIKSVRVDANTTLYADEVTVGHSYNNYKNKYVDYKNSTYKAEVLAKYLYEKPYTIESMLQSEANGLNKTKILLEDLSVARSIVTVDVPISAMSVESFIYELGEIELSYINRTFKGTLRVQLIGILYDTKFNVATLILRQRDYSSVFYDITGSGLTPFVIGEASTPEVIGEAVTPIVIGGEE